MVVKKLTQLVCLILFVAACSQLQKTGVERGLSSDKKTEWLPTQSQLQTWFGSCELLHLTDQGFIRLAPTPFLKKHWGWQDLVDLKEISRYRLQDDLDVRSTFHLQMAYATSFQASAVFQKLQDEVTNELGVEGRANVKIDRKALAELALLAHYESRNETPLNTSDRAAADLSPAQKMPNCAVTKWLNKRPDVYLWPVSYAFKHQLARLFSAQSVVRQGLAGVGFSSEEPFTQPEIEQFMVEGELDKEAIYELRALRLATALFERQSLQLMNDIGGWDGNKAEEGKKFVCTDEATTHYALIRFFIQEVGLLNHFVLDADTRFAFRRPPLDISFLDWVDQKANELFGITDHFGVILVHKKTGHRFVIDSWVEDGGVPAHVSRLEDWLVRGETKNVVSIGDPKWDRVLSREFHTFSSDEPSGAQTTEPLRRKTTAGKDAAAELAHRNYTDLLAYLNLLMPPNGESRHNFDPTEPSAKLEIKAFNRYRFVKWPIERSR